MPKPGDLYASDLRALKREIKALGPVDVIVGIPSYQEADSIAHVVRQCDIGLREYFGDRKCLIINVDNNSPDGTRNAFLTAGSKTPQLYISTPRGVTGKGNNFWNLFQAATRLKAKAVVCVDADLLSITPQWVRNLAGPIVNGGVDYITPIYARNEYDGTITNNICYPLIYGLLGTDLRQPIGGDFGLSGRFADDLLAQPWSDTTRQFGIDIFLTSSALFGGWLVGQTHLGIKAHKPSAPKLGPMFTQVVTTLFSKLLKGRKQWSLDDRVAGTPEFDGIATGDPQSLSVDYKAIKRTVLHQYWEHRTTLERRLAPATFASIDKMIRAERMNLGAGLWSRAVYDLLAGFAKARGNARAAVIEALKPLYFARSASFYRDTLDMDSLESEAKIIAQAKTFRSKRSYAVERLSS